MEQTTAILQKTRTLSLDSLRGLLMLCVIAGHLSEILPGFGTEHPLYLFLYSFHMPAFVFLSGYFGRCNSKTLLRTIGLYLLFQFLYSLFAHLVLYHLSLSSYQFSAKQPYWLLWYLLTLSYYYLSVLFLKRLSGTWFFVVFTLSLAVSLLCGYCKTVGYPFSLSRTLVFYPYFVAGYFLGQKKSVLLPLCDGLQHKAVYSAIAGILAIVGTLLLFLLPLKGYMLYGSYPYNSDYTLPLRLAQFAVASLWIHFFFCIAFFWQRLRIPVLSFVGRYSLYFYLLHGFVIKLLAKRL